MWIFCKNKNTKTSLFEQRMWNLGYLSRKHDKINLTLSIYILQVKKLRLRDGKQMLASTRAESKTQVSGLSGKHYF